MLSLQKLTMLMGSKLLFHEIDLLINKSGRYGVVGANGTGKSTLFKLIANELQPTDGQIRKTKELKIGWLNQDHFKFDDELIINVVIRGNVALWSALTAKKELLQQKDFDEQAANELAELEEVIQHENGYTAESNAEDILVGLGVKLDCHYDQLSSLSGGYKMRVLLAQSLFNNPDILLLDEPTNHLDIMTTQWLENYLIKNYNGILLFISHDRDFLNNLSTHILDLDYGDIRLYHGNYNKFCEKKQEIVEQKDKERSSSMKKIQDMQKFVDRFKAKASKARQAQSRMKMIDKIQLPEKEVSSRNKPYMNFNVLKQSGKNTLTVNSVSKSYGSRELYSNLKFNIRRGEKIAIIGHNGIGKSTLIKQLLNFVEGEDNDFIWGSDAKISYFSQDHHEQLKDNTTVYQWLRNLPLKVDDSEIRKTLGRMLFTKEQVNKNILSLSGGEAARVLLVRIILEKSNILIFDEPTNHMDLEAIESLQEALVSYQGTLLLVSHNRYFVSNVADRIFVMTEYGMKDHLGGYNDFISQYGEDYLCGKWLKSSEISSSRS